MADDTTTIDKPPVSETGGVDTSSALTAKPAELETPARATAPAVPAKSKVEEIGERLIPEYLRGAERAGQAAEEYAASVKREQEARQRQREATRPVREEQLKTIDTEETFLREHPREPPQELPKRPQLKYDLREIFGPPGSDKAGNKFMDQIGVFASLSGRTTQERLILALTAFNGMVEGWAKGKKENFDEAYSAWKDEITNIHDTENRKRQYVNDVLNDTKTSLDLKAKKIELLGLEDGDTMLAEQAFRKDLAAVDGFLDQRINYLDGAMKTADTVQKHIDKQDVEANSAGIDEAVSEWYLGYREVPTTGLRAGPLTVAADARARERVNAEATSRGVTPDVIRAEIAARRTDFLAGRTGATAAARTGGTMDVRITSAANEVARLIPLADSSAKEVSRYADFKWTTLNQMRNAFLAGSSDPRYYNFLVNTESLLRAWGRAMNPTGQPRVSEINNARLENVLSRTTSLEAYEGMLRQLWNEVQATREAVEDTRAGRAPPNPFETPSTVPGAPAVPGGPKSYPGVRSIEEVH
jgi:hypothetical protein